MSECRFGANAAIAIENLVRNAVGGKRALTSLPDASSCA